MKIQSRDQFVTNALRLLTFLIVTSVVCSFAFYGQALGAETSIKSSRQDDEVATFFSAPIDLVAFKSKKGSSNSTSVKREQWFYTPKQLGFFYQYTLFPTPKEYTESERLNDFAIVVYKFGKVIGDYSDTNEELVGIWSRIKDSDLGAANLVGTHESEIRKRFGKPFAEKEGIIIYHHDKRALSLHLTNGIVDWFKFVRLSQNIENPESIPDILLEPGL